MNIRRPTDRPTDDHDKNHRTKKRDITPRVPFHFKLTGTDTRVLARWYAPRANSLRCLGSNPRLSLTRNLLVSSTSRGMHHRDEALINCNLVGSGGLNQVRYACWFWSDLQRSCFFFFFFFVCICPATSTNNTPPPSNLPSRLILPDIDANLANSLTHSLTPSSSPPPRHTTPHNSPSASSSNVPRPS
jgi:hypothetical protein